MTSKAGLTEESQLPGGCPVRIEEEEGDDKHSLPYGLPRCDVKPTTPECESVLHRCLTSGVSTPASSFSRRP